MKANRYDRRGSRIRCDCNEGRNCAKYINKTMQICNFLRFIYCSCMMRQGERALFLAVGVKLNVLASKRKEKGLNIHISMDIYTNSIRIMSVVSHFFSCTKFFHSL